MKPTLLYIITQGTWGGAQRYVYDLATALGEAFSIVVAVGDPNGPKDLQQKLAAQGIAVRQLRHLVRPISPAHDLLAIKELHNLYQELQPAIVHLNSSKAGIVGSLAASGTHQQKLVYTVHGWAFNEPLSPLRTGLYRWLEKMTAKRKNAIITLSTAEANQGTQTLKLVSKKLITIPLGVAPQQLASKATARRQIEQKLGRQLPAHTSWIGTIGNYFATKGLDILINAVVQQKNLPPANFVLIGDGEERNHLQKLIARHNLADRIFLTGFIPEAATLLSAFDLFVLPSHKEGFPYVLLEARQAGLPIIATAVGGVPELLAKYPAGHLVEKNNSAALGAELQRWLTEQTTPVSTDNHFPFPLKQMVASTTSLYWSLLDQKP